MAKFNIISKDGELVRFSGCPKYTGTFLGVSFLEFMSIESPTLIEWEIGDYIDYDRTGLRYKLYSLPIPKKQARAGANGASFVYSNVKFYAETKDLEIAPFRDIVPEDNKIHFSTRPDVSTYENVYGLARRIQACMDDVFPDKWRIEVYNTDDAKLLETLNETKDFSISNSNCLQTLSQIYEKWDNVGWIHSYDSAQDKHIITIGRSSIRDNENTSDAFAYGLGNGLTSIKKASTNEDEFATRLYVYGSDRNIQTRYYKGFNILNAESVDIRNLMLPISTWGKTDGLPDARKAYLEADESIIAKYGLIPRTVYFDGSQNEAIYPSIQGLKMSQVREEMITAGQEDSKHLPPNENIRIDKTGYIIISLNSMIFDLGDGSKADVESNPTFLLSLPAVGFDIAEQGALTSEGLATISMKSGPCAGREFKVKSYWGYTNQLPYGYHAYEVYRNWDESLGLGFPNKTYKINEGDEYVLLDIPMPDYYITLAEKRLLEAGQKKLAECTKISPYYEPAIDSIIIKESGKTLREGMYMQISDPDIIDTEDGKDYVLIDTLTIDEKAEIPKYSVTLRKQKKTSKSFAALESRVGASEKSLSTLTSEKAGKSDTYSKANIDNLLKKYLLLEAIKQTVKGDIELEGNLKVKGDIFSTGQFAAAAVGTEGGGSVGATYLSDLYDVSLGSLLSGDILSWNGNEWVNIKQSSLVPDLSGYLPKSGGTIDSTSWLPLVINSSFYDGSVAIQLSSNGVTKAGVVYNSEGAYIYNYSLGYFLGISDSGRPNYNGHTLIHSGNYSDYALPLTGGTIEGGSGIYTPLTIKNTSLSEVWIGFQDAHGTCYIGSSNGVPSVNMGADNKTLIHSGNYSDYALPKSGGEISGVVYIKTSAGNPLQIFSSSGVQSGTAWFINDTPKSWFGYDANGTNIYDYAHAATLGIATDGVPKFNNHTLIHSGNIGSQSVNYATSAGNANSLNGISSGNYAYYSPDANGAYLAFNINDYSFAQCGQGDKYIEYYDNGAYYNSVWGWVMAIHGFKGNADSATKLATPRTIWGQSFDGTGNVDGYMFMSGLDVLHLDESNLWLNYGAADDGKSLRLCGNDVAIYYGKSSNFARAMTINPSGNVLIGSTTDNGAKVSIVSTSAKTLALYRTTTGGGSFIDYHANNDTSNQWRVGHNYDSVGSSFVFNKFNGTTESTLVSIKENGNVLIGTTTDNGEKLQVNGGIEADSISSYDSGTGYFVGKRNSGLGATDGGLLLYTYGATPMSFYINGAERMRINPSGNVTIGGSDWASSLAKLFVQGKFVAHSVRTNEIRLGDSIEDTSSYLNNWYYASIGYEYTDQAPNTLKPDIVFKTMYQTYAENSGEERMRIKANGNVLIGTTSDSGYKLDVAGNVRVTDNLTTGGDINVYSPSARSTIRLVSQSNVPTDLIFGSNKTQHWSITSRDSSMNNSFAIYHYITSDYAIFIDNNRRFGVNTTNPQHTLDVAGTVRVTDTLTAQNGIVTNEITIGGIKLDVYDGALRVNGDIFATGQFAASVAGEATGGNIVLDYASIVNALGYTPANNNNLAQVAFTGSYNSLLNTPSVYTKEEVYNKNEINQKLAGVGGSGGSIGSTFGMDYINGQSFDMPNGVNCVTSYSDATVNFSSVVPADPSLPCIIYIVKCDYHTLQVTSGCNIVSVNSSGDEVIDFSINGMTGMMLVWEPDYWRWFAYLQK